MCIKKYKVLRVTHPSNLLNYWVFDVTQNFEIGVTLQKGAPHQELPL